MLKADYSPELTPLDHQVFSQLVPEDHYLRRLKAAVDFSQLRPLLADCYSAEMGRGALDPVCLLKLLLLQFHYGWSDESVVQQAQVNVAIRFFLDWPLSASLPDPSLLTHFRKRLGAERLQRVFNEVLRQARAAGLVKDRLRLKDATHVIANIAVPATIQLIAQAREKLLAAADPFAPSEVAQHRQEAAEIRTATIDQGDAARLLRRVEHLRQLVSWAEAWQPRLDLGAPPVSEQVYENFITALELARKVLNDREPKAPDQLRSLTDTDARRNKHGEYYDGYLLDVSMDADSELICAVEVLPSNSDEAANAKQLIESEESAQGNDVERLSMDAIGYNGAVLKALSDDPDGPQLIVYTPPIEFHKPTPGLFQSDDFRLSQAGNTLTCPAGQQTATRSRDNRDHAWQFRFSAAQCHNCPLRAQCLKPETRNGRSVYKSDYEAQYRAAQQCATTDEFQQIRKEHSAIERKLSELVRWHDGRRVRYRTRLRVKVQYLLLAVVVNCKRIVRLLNAAPKAQPA
jgi:transposase